MSLVRAPRTFRRIESSCRLATLALSGALAAVALNGCSGKEENAGAAAEPTIAATPALLERGRYLAHAANCASCHTTAEGAVFSGGVGFETPFGTIYSANITPDPATGIGGWTMRQFVQSLRHGVRPSGERLYPVFPYTAFTKITDEDAAALFWYLKSKPAVRFEAPRNDMRFPFGQRWLLAPWQTLFLDAVTFKPQPTRSEEINRGAYLVQGLAHCSACHSPRNLLGAERGGTLMTGGTFRDGGSDGVTRPWSAPNLTPVSNGLGAWPATEIVAYLKNGTNAYAMSYGPMNEVIMNGTHHLSDADLLAMAVYLKSLPPDESVHGASASAAILQTGETLYNVHCGTCHQPDGLGADESAPRLAGSLVVQAGDPASLINIILYGPDLPNPVPSGHRWRQMEAHGDDLSDEEVSALTSYIRSAWNNRAGAVTPEQVEAQR